MREPNIPRRDVLEARLRKVIYRLNRLQTEYEEELAELEVEEAQIQMYMSWHSFSQARKDLIERVEALPEEPGVYEICCGKEVVYVGEAQNIRKRCRDHLNEVFFISGQAVTAKVYKRLATEDPASLSFDAVLVGVKDKRERLKEESLLIERRKLQGHPLTNAVVVKGSPIKTGLNRKKIVTTEEAWEDLLQYMTPDVRDASYILWVSD